MRVGGRNGIEVDERGVRAGGLVVASRGQPVGSLPSQAPSTGQAPRPLPTALSASGVISVGRVAAQAGAGVIALGSLAAAALVLTVGAPLGLLVFPSAGIAAALALGLLGRQLASGASAASVERTLLEAAARAGGSLTVAQAALALGAPLASADAALTSLARAGHVAVDVDDSSGSLRYRFHGLEQDKQLPTQAASR